MAIVGTLVGAVVTAAAISAGTTVFPDAQRLAAGARHTCVVMGDGAVQCWGDNRDGQLGDGTRTSRATAAPVKGVVDAVEVVAGMDHTCARRRGGEVVCWGSAEYGEVGDGEKAAGSAKDRLKRMRDGTTVARTEPVAVIGLGSAEQLWAGRAWTCARVGGKPWCWGRIPDGEEVWPTPRPLTGVDAFDEMALGWHYVCVRVGGEVMCRAPEGRDWKVGKEFKKLEGIDDAVGMAGGSDHLCVLHRQGRVTCMGNLPYLFEVDSVARAWSTKIEIEELTDVVRLMPASRGDHACGVRRGGEVRCWGWGHDGQLGHGLFQPWRRPVAVIGVSGPRALVGGHAHTCALTEAREVRCWGENRGGQLGWEPAKLEVPELRKGRGGSDDLAMQLREMIRNSATPVVALKLE